MGGGKDRNVYRLIHILSDGSEETDLVVYDNSAFVADVTKGNLVQIWSSGSDAVIRLEWDQTTDAPVFAGNPANTVYHDYRQFGGIKNPGDTGATGDLLLTTSGLDSGDEIFLILHIVQS